MQAARPTRRREHIAWLTLVAIGVFIAFWDVLGSDRSLWLRGHHDVWRPHLWNVAEALSQLRLPTIGGPDPMALPPEHQLGGTFTPLIALFFFIDFSSAYDAFIIGQFLLLGVGTYVLVFGWTNSCKSACVAASIAALSGPVLSLDASAGWLSGLAWLPWLILAVHHCANKPGAASAGLVAICLAFHLQGGSWVMMAIGAPVLLSVIARRMSKGAAMWLTVGVLLGTTGALVAVMPVFEARLPEDPRLFSDLSAWRWVELLVPSAMAPPDAPFLEVSTLTGGPAANSVKSLYLGCALALAALGARGRVGTAAVLAIIASLLLAFNASTMSFATAAPFGRGLESANVLLIAVAAVAVLAARAVRDVTAAPQRLVLQGLLHVIAVSIVFGVATSDDLVVYLSRAYADFPLGSRFLGVIPHDTPLLRAIDINDSRDLPAMLQSALQPRLLHAAAAAVTITVLGLVAHAAPRYRDALGTAVVLCIVLDLAIAGRFTIFGVEPVAPSPDVVAALSASNRRVFSLRRPGYESRVALGDNDTYAQALLRSHIARGGSNPAIRAFLPERPVGYLRSLPRRSTDEMTWGLRMRGMMDEATREEATVLYERAGVAHVTTWFTSFVGGARLVNAFDVPSESPEYVFALPNPTPYAYAYSSWEQFTPNGNIRNVRDLVFDADRRHVGVLVGDVERTRTATTCHPSLTTTSSRPDRIDLALDSECEALVVVQEHLHKGWRVWIDGVQAKMRAAEMGSIAALVPSGRHIVRFEYVAHARRWAPWSAGALGAALILIAVGALRRRQTSS